ncbi:beta-ketoacyl-ACP synthase 3 [Conexibacter arvalis]|uniref:3-oxoacyl-[acyl-carrier-protein] synthase-3 n=1 Tax=Conexibacter arvalis TaxID=912552 RepID=A0A840IIF7_9ACTN|nr:3-oxoacyl-[acyl-carrier-protein] synthase-3 [Conexibacter arvalis]
MPEQAPTAAGMRAPSPALSRGAAIRSVAAVLPETVVHNDAVAARIGKSDDWIYTRTGIRERRVARDDERLADFATEAGRIALERAGVAGPELDLVLVATMTQDEITPNTAPLVAHALGAERAGAIDVGAACTSFLSALALAAAQVESGRVDRVLVVGADFISRITDHDSKATAMLFADGAGAVVVTPADPADADEVGSIGPILLHADGAEPEILYATRERGTIEMDGHETFKHAVNRMAAVTREAVAAAGLELGDIELFAYHQANGRIVRAVGERLALDPARVVDCIEKTGNMSAASIPFALDAARRDGRLRPGARVLLSAFGAGFTWGGGVIQWGGTL